MELNKELLNISTEFLENYEYFKEHKTKFRMFLDMKDSDMSTHHLEQSKIFLKEMERIGKITENINENIKNLHLHLAKSLITENFEESNKLKLKILNYETI